jgi:hypothetical protein
MEERGEEEGKGDERREERRGEVYKLEQLNKTLFTNDLTSPKKKS